MGDTDKTAREHLLKAWIFVVFGVLIPFIALWGAFMGGQLVNAGRRAMGIPVLVAGILVAGVRFYLYARTGFTSAW